MTEKQIELSISGMTCVSCAQHVVRALESVQGVQQAHVPGWQSGQATVIAGQDLDVERLTAAVDEAGYGAALKEASDLAAVQDQPANGQRGADFDLLVVGGGSGGFAAAIAASDLGRRVGMINEGLIGGTCVNVGCIPSKALIRSAQAWHQAGQHAFKGVHTAQHSLDWQAIRDDKDALIGQLRQSKYVDVLAAYPDITFIEGRATFQEDGSVQVGDSVYRASKYVIATGAQPRMIPFPGIAEVEPLNSTSLMDLDELPESLIILGGRAVALELGQTMARLGVNVVILQRSPQLLPDHDPDISRAIRGYLEDEGIGVVTGVEVERLAREGDTRVVEAKVMSRRQEFRAEQVMMALGRQPNTRHIGLEAVGVSLDSNDAIIVDEAMQTTNPLIYATGDVTTLPEFVYVAAAGGTLAARNALNGTHLPFDLSAMPAVIFTDPQIATVGLTENQAKEAGYEVDVSRVDLEHVPRAQAARDLRGFIKLVADSETGRILGAHILAAEGGEIIQTATLAVKFGLTIEDLTGTLFPYLTQVEGLKLAAQAFTKNVAMLSCCA